MVSTVIEIQMISKRKDSSAVIRNAYGVYVSLFIRSQKRFVPADRNLA